MPKLCKEDIRRFIRFIGDDPDRDELKNTPDNVLNSIEHYFSSYSITNPEDLVHRLEATEKSNDIILVKNIDFVSFCEHHILPISGKINVGYIPDKFIAGIGSIGNAVKFYTRRLQIQERICAQIANLLDQTLEPKGVAIMIEARHMCVMCENNISFITLHKTGAFKEDNQQMQNFLSLIRRLP